MTQIIQDILKLSVPERILMVEAIWDSISDKEELLELSTETKHLLDERLDDHNRKPEDGSDWETVKKRIKNQF